MRKRIIISGILEWYMAATLLFAFLECAWTGGSVQIVKELLGGIEESGGVIMPVPMGRWLLIFGWFFLIVALEISHMKKMAVFEVYRWGTFCRWWLHKAFRIQSEVLVLYMEMLLVWKTVECVTGKRTEDIGRILFIFWVHLFLMVTVQISLDLFFTKGLMAAILIVVEGIGYVIAEQNGNALLAGGMYVRSRQHMEGGFSTGFMCGTELLMAVGCYVMIEVFGKKGCFERKLYGKED